MVVWGESFGGITALLAITEKDIQKDVDGLFLDCPVSTMEDMIKQSLEEMHLPLPMHYAIACGNFVNKMKFDFTYEDANALKKAHTITIPTLIFNSEKDTITSSVMGKALYDSIQAKQKDLYTSKSCKHIEIRNHERNTYISYIENYL